MTATVSQGTKFTYATHLVGLLTSVSGVDMSTDTIDTTALDSTDGFKTFVASYRDAGEIQVQGHFVGGATGDVGQQAMVTDFLAGLNTAQACSIEFNDKVVTSGSKWTFNAVVTNLKTDAPMNGVVSFEAKLKISGKPTFTVAV